MSTTTISGLGILSTKGEVLLYRDYRSEVSRSDFALFGQRVVQTRLADENPVVELDDCHFAHITVNSSLLLVAAVKTDVNISAVFVFLARLSDLLRFYLLHSEDAVRRHVPLVLELLDEVVDFGVIQLLEPEFISKYIAPISGHLATFSDPAELSKLTVAATGATSWRSDAVRHKKNEIFIDVLESVHVLLSAKGTLLKAEVAGVVKIRSMLSGMPECKLGLNDILAGTTTLTTTPTTLTTTPTTLTTTPNTTGGGASQVSLADTHFHQCVRLQKFDAERAVTFVPPDGNFDLMTYRVSENVAVPFQIIPVIERLSSSPAGAGKTARYSVNVKVRANYADPSIFALNVTLLIPLLTKGAVGNVISDRSSGGKLAVAPGGGALVWKLAKFPGDAEYVIQAEVGVVAGAGVGLGVGGVGPLSLEFEIPMFTASGLRVRFLKVVEKSNYKPTKWIRYLTKAGEFHHRQ